MPPLPIISGAHRVSIIWAPGTQRAIITFGISSSLSDLDALATSIDANVTAGMWGSVSPAITATEMQILKYDGTTPTYKRSLSGAKWTGSAAAGDFTVALAALVSLRTAARGPWARGRIYLPFTCESVIASGTLIAGTQTAMQTAWNTFRSAMSAAGNPLGVVSISTNPGPPPRVPTIRPVITLVVETPLATQRRRQERLR